MFAAMVQGGAFAKATKRAPEERLAWEFAVIASAISVALLTMYYFALSSVYPAFITALLAEIGLAIVGPTLLAISCGLILLVNRFALSVGAKLTLKAAAEKPGGKP